MLFFGGGEGGGGLWNWASALLSIQELSDHQNIQNLHLISTSDRDKEINREKSMVSPLFLNALTHQAFVYWTALPRHYRRGFYMYVYEPEPPFMHVTDFCWFLISFMIELYRKWGGGGVGLRLCVKGTQAWDILWLRFRNLYFFVVTYA